MNMIRVLHYLSHLRWLFMGWIVALLLYIFFFKPENGVQLTGTVLVISGLMMGFTSLSDVERISKKERKDLSNPKAIKIQYISLFCAVIVVLVISVVFLSLRFIYPSADKSFIIDFTKLGYDCLVMILGILCLVKQHAEKVNYVKWLNDNKQR